MRSFFAMWIGDVAMKTWMRGRSAWRTASHARSTSLNPVRESAGDDRAAHRLGDRLDGLEVAVTRDREAGLDDVDPEAGELLGDLELLADVERDARRLLAVSQRRVEDQHTGPIMTRSLLWFSGTKGNEKPPRPEGTRRWTRAPEGARS